ncbi:uncharacterized protein UHO2_00833 [Ustilago hordei]|uniref:uncharacterized protein n=1 Tax=Ustilago hordei TaxID=120017 RepID=UPI001A3DCD87|nr:uncharacterized protein UHO2_00833 [Ustilago hordei]SYW73968.1 uncharacterized protein UHO2_00833 [Ustilago hordei]
MQGIDYHDTYSSVVSMTCLQLIICYGLKFNFRIRKIDFVVAYLNGELTDVDIYMALLPGFEDRYRQSPRSACHLKKALYGPKQSGPEWFAKNENGHTWQHAKNLFIPNLQLLQLVGSCEKSKPSGAEQKGGDVVGSLRKGRGKREDMQISSSGYLVVFCKDYSEHTCFSCGRSMFLYWILCVCINPHHSLSDGSYTPTTLFEMEREAL